MLVSTRNPLNIGAAARALSNFGFFRLRVVNPYEVAFRQARSAVGAADVLAKAEIFSSVADAVADCTLVVGTTAAKHRQFHHSLKRFEEGAGLIRTRLGKSRVALLFGSEKYGLSNEDLAHCHWLARIPTRDQHVSMNLGQAVAICLYELARTAKGSAKAEKGTPAAAAEVERLTALLLEVLHDSGYVHPQSSDSAQEKARRFIRRMNLSAADTAVWLGMLRQVAWKLRSAETSKP